MSQNMSLKKFRFKMLANTEGYMKFRFLVGGLSKHAETITAFKDTIVEEVLNDRLFVNTTINNNITRYDQIAYKETLEPLTVRVEEALAVCKIGENDFIVGGFPYNEALTTLLDSMRGECIMYVSSVVTPLYSGGTQNYDGVYITCEINYNNESKLTKQKLKIIESFLKEAGETIVVTPQKSKEKKLEDEKNIPVAVQKNGEIVFHNINLESELKQSYFFSSDRELGRMLVATAIYSEVFNTLCLGAQDA